MPSSVASKYIIQHLHLHQCHVSIFIYVTISPRMYVHISTVVRFNKSQDIIGRSRETQSQHNLLLIYDRWPRSAHYPTGASKSKYKQNTIRNTNKNTITNTNKNTFGNENKKAMLQIRHFLQRNNTDGAVHPGRHIQFGLQSECSPRPKQTEKGKR